MINLVRQVTGATRLVALLLAGQLLLTLVPFSAAQQPWTSNLLNLFSDNFRNLLQQVPSAPLPTASLSNPLLTQPSSSPSSFSTTNPSPSSQPLASPYDAYTLASRYSRSKDEILQYSDEDPSIQSNGLQQQANYYNGLAGYNPNYNSNYNPNYNPSYNPSPYQSPALNSFAGDYYNYQLDNTLAAQPPASAANQFAPVKPAGAQFDEDPLYSQYVLNKNKNLDPLNLNKNVLFDDYTGLGLDLSAYNLDNIYHNQHNYNRLPVAPAHVSYVPPPIPNLQASSNQARPPVVRPVADLQPSPNSLVANNLNSNLNNNNHLINGNQLVAGPDSVPPQSAYSSFLAANKEALSSLNFNLGLNSAPSQLRNPLATDQLISANSVEQKYEQAKPFFLADKSAKLLATSVDLPPAAPASLQPSSNALQPSPNSLQQSVPVSLPTSGVLPAASASQPGTLPLSDLNQLYNAFATIPFGNHHNFNTLNNQISSPKVIYYDNFINHQASSQQQSIASPSTSTAALPSAANPTPSINQQQPDVQSSSIADQSGSLLLANSLDSSLSNSLGSSLSSSLGNPRGSSSPSLSDSTNNPTSLTTLNASAVAVAPNLSSNLEVTTQSQLAKPTVRSKAIRKKPVKIKRKQQRANQRDFGARNRRKDELEAIER